MKILSDYTNQNVVNTNFKSLKISYEAVHRLKKTSPGFISFLFDAGRRLENTQYVDLQVLRNLDLRIASKVNPYYAIKEPVNLIRTSEKQIKIQGTYAGKEDSLYSNGKTFDIYLDFEREGTADVTMDNYNSMRGINRLSYLAKIIDIDLINKNDSQVLCEQTRENIVSNLIYKYGDIIV